MRAPEKGQKAKARAATSKPSIRPPGAQGRVRARTASAARTAAGACAPPARPRRWAHAPWRAPPLWRAPTLAYVLACAALSAVPPGGVWTEQPGGELAAPNPIAAALLAPARRARARPLPPLAAAAAAMHGKQAAGRAAARHARARARTDCSSRAGCSSRAPRARTAHARGARARAARLARGLL